MENLQQAINRNEVIADSEDEDLSGLQDDLQAAFYGDLSPEPESNRLDAAPWQNISNSDTTVPHIDLSTVSNAAPWQNASTSDTSIPHIDLSTISNAASSSKPRPRPRPITMGKVTNDTSAGSVNNSPGHEYLDYMSSFQVDVLPGSIADRAKTRQRKSKSSILEPDDIIETSAVLDTTIYNEVIELTDNDDDFAAKPSKKKTKKKPAPKSKKKSFSDPLVDPDSATTIATASASLTDPKPKPRPKPRPLKRKVPTSPLPFPDSTSQPTNIPTSSLEAPIPFPLAPSQLLHSDPAPPPTSTPPNPDLPRIETLPIPSTDGPPSSLFSVNDTGANGATRDVDELESDAAGMRMDMDETSGRISPPPTFFAQTSTSDAGDEAVIDLTLLPPTMDPVAPAKGPGKKAPAKASKSRKKKGDAVAGNGEAAASETKKTKARGKTKKDKLHCEVVIPVAKETFKSNEFIDDDDDELDVLGRSNVVYASTPKLTITLPASKAKPNSLSSLSSVHASEPEDGSAAQDSTKKRKSKDMKDDNDIAKIASPQKKAKGKKSTGKGKGKAVVSETEDEFDGAAAAATKKSKGKGTSRRKLAFMSDEDEDAQEESVIHATSVDQIPDEAPPKSSSKKGKRKRAERDDAEEDLDASEAAVGNIPSEEATKENLEPRPQSSSPNAKLATSSGEVSSKGPDPPKKETPSQYTSLTSQYTIAPRTKSTPMSELIRKVNSQPGSPFVSPSPGLIRKRPSMGLAYSPYLKSSRSMLSKIAPLHPNRRTPPPPLPPPPPRKKTKKELEMEEKWEEELIESVGGITEWACMTDAERKEMRRAKKEKEMYGYDD